ncbi:hypothetical protein K501DRAFT_224749 [Backusella circina FSU 941]|nr:hypothetical protein K501DRAFT_224749 [Backusella circina FSU 941]
MNDQESILQQDLHYLKVKELHDIIRDSNNLIRTQQRVSTSGRKNEIISRYSTFLMSLLSTQRHSVINSIVNIVNSEARGKFHWGYNNNEIVSSRSRYARPALWERQNATTLNQVTFGMEPFFKVVSMIKQPQLIPASNTRNTSKFQFDLTPEQVRLLSLPLEQDGKAKYQVRFCCAVYSTHSQSLEKGLPLEFPNTCELKINETVVNNTALRCIKGKPGTIHPADLTTGINKTGPNRAELLYVQTHQQFVAAIYIVERKTIESFIEEMKRSGQLSKERVLEKLKITSEDADIVMESETLSTKCPLAFIRIQIPCRSIHCNHLQCFDANTFLVMNEQTPTWSCPICYKHIADSKDLAIDEYFSDMLQKVPSSVESVKVEPDGTIIMNEQQDSQSFDSSDDEDDTNNKKSIKTEEVERSVDLLQPVNERSNNNNTVIVLDDSDDDDTNDDTDDSRMNGNQAETNQPENQIPEQQVVMQNTLQDPLQIQLQQQIHLQLQQQQNYSPYGGNPPAMTNGYHLPYPVITNGYPNAPLGNGNTLPVPGKQSRPLYHAQGPPAKRPSNNNNTIDLTLSSDDEV